MTATLLMAVIYADREALPLNPVGWQPEDDEDTEKRPPVRLDVLEIK